MATIKRTDAAGVPLRKGLPVVAVKQKTDYLAMNSARISSLTGRLDKPLLFDYLLNFFCGLIGNRDEQMLSIAPAAGDKLSRQFQFTKGPRVDDLFRL